ncbi:MAG TPA: hypothetical protein VM120_00255 [Bryobacteraceae bacterium]|nr:hypothetical protein [Bryobacteraceae bacterium]
MTIIMYLQGGLALTLQVLLLQAMLRNAGRRYILLTLYICSLFLSTVMELSIRVSSSGRWTSTAKQYYFASEIIQQVLVFATILGFIYQQLGRGETRVRVSRWLIPAAILAISLSVYFHQDARLNFWFTSVSRDLSFFATLLNLMLWGSLLRDRNRDARLLMVSGALGIQLAGNATGQGLRLLVEWSRILLWMGNSVSSLTYLLSLYVLYRAFRKPEPVPWRDPVTVSAP